MFRRSFRNCCCSSSSSNSEINNLAQSLSEFQIKPLPHLLPPPAPQQPPTPPPPTKKKILNERRNNNTIQNYFLSFIPPHQVWEANKIVDFYNYIVNQSLSLSKFL